MDNIEVKWKQKTYKKPIKKKNKKACKLRARIVAWAFDLPSNLQISDLC